MKLKWKAAALLLCLTFAIPARAQDLDIAVVVNPANAISNLTLTDLRKIFSGQKHTWPGGQAVRLFVRAPGSPERAALLKLLDMSESDYKKHWTTLIFRGEVQEEPVTLPSNGMQMEAVRSFPGAVALIVVRDERAGIKVLKLDGRLPGEAGYPLH